LELKQHCYEEEGIDVDVTFMADVMNLGLVENFKTAELRQTCRFGRPATSPIFDVYSVCTLEFQPTDSERRQLA
jgi:hypothetical protein